METHRRLALWLLMLLVTVVLFIKGRATPQEEVSAAFVHHGATQSKVRFEGNVVNPGIYEYPIGSDLMTVMKMTLPELSALQMDRKLLNQVIHSGDVVRVLGNTDQHAEITIKRMTAREMVVLGIPLDPNRMGAEDWQSLPGIGPLLALRIIDDRQNNGDFRSLQDLERVPGIGEKKIKQLAEYF